MEGYTLLHNSGLKVLKVLFKSGKGCPKDNAEDEGGV